jgi:GntR family transcriptional regulator, carbon starvation induced regulator
MSVVTAKTLAEHVFQRLRDDLKSNKYSPGERLKFEEMQKNYAVSGAPLREALCRLMGLGLVVQIGQKGFRAATVSREDLDHLIATRKFLEDRALQESINNGNEEWEGSLVAAFHRLKKASDFKPTTKAEYLSWERYHGEFHFALLAGCGSPWLLETWRTVFDQAERYRRLAMKSGHWIIDQKADHDRLLKAALARDAVAASKILQRHIGRSAHALPVGHGYQS